MGSVPSGQWSWWEVALVGRVAMVGSGPSGQWSWWEVALVGIVAMVGSGPSGYSGDGGKWP